MAFYNFSLKMIKIVQESIYKINPIMAIEKCIWRLTKEQGDWFNLDCEYLAKGKVADLVIINPEKFNNITEDVNLDAIEEFGNYAILVNRSAGVVSRVMVGGKTIFEKEQFLEGYAKSNKYGRFLEKVF